MAVTLWTFSLTLLCCLAFTSATDTSKDCKNFAAIGQRYEVPLSIDWNSEHRLRWRHGTKIIYDSKGKQNTGSVTSKGSFILSKVTKEDHGEYTAEIVDAHGVQTKSDPLMLCVLENVSKPKVEVKCDKQLAKVQFTCIVSATEGMNYEWLEGTKTVANANAKILMRNFNQLGSNSFRCKVSNKVSSQTSDPVQQTCLKTGSPDAEDEENMLFGLDKWLMVGILAGGGGLVLVLIVATIICCSINRRKRRFREKDEQELRLQWSTNNQQHQHHQYHHTNPQDHTNPRDRTHPRDHAHRPAPGTQGPAEAGHTGPRPQRTRQNRPRPPDPITGQPLPGPRRQAPEEQTQVPKPTIGDDEDAPPPLPHPRKKGPRTQKV